MKSFSKPKYDSKPLSKDKGQSPANPCTPGKSDDGEGPHIEATDEYVYSHSTVLLNRAHRAFRAQEKRLVADEFAGFVLAEEPGAALVLCAARQAFSFSDAKHNLCAGCGRVATTVEIKAGVHRGHEVGLGQKKFNRGKGKLKDLARKFMHLSLAAAQRRHRGAYQRLELRPLRGGGKLHERTDGKNSHGKRATHWRL